MTLRSALPSQMVVYRSSGAAERAELDSLRSHVHEQLRQIVDDFIEDLQKQSLMQAVASLLPLRLLAACALQHGLLRKHAPKRKRAEVRDVPMLPSTGTPWESLGSPICLQTVAVSCQSWLLTSCQHTVQGNRAMSDDEFGWC